MRKLKSLDNFVFVDYETDLNSILFKCDYLITDYSGVVFDYLLLNKPIIFIYLTMSHSEEIMDSNLI